MIDGATDTVIATITAGSGPWGLVYNPTNNKIYCANHSDYNVTVIDGTNDTVITTITVNGGPKVLLYNSTNNKIYCANDNGDNVAVIDGAGDTVITTIAVGDLPLALAWNPVQNRTYVANYSSSNISVILDELAGIEKGLMPNTISSKLETYPNPAKSVLRVRCPLSPKETNLKIFDVSGKLIKKIASLAARNDSEMEMKVSLKGITPGIYFLQFGNTIRKFLVVR